MLIDAKTYLQKRNIPLDDARFLFIRQLLNKNLKYCYLFTYLCYEENLTTIDMSFLYDMLTHLKDHLYKLKDVTTYRSHKVLLEDLKKLDRDNVAKKFIDCLPSYLEAIVYKAIDTAKLSKVDSFFKAVYEFDKLHSDYKKDFIVSVSRLNTFQQLLVSLTTYLKFVKEGKDIKTIKTLYPTLYGVRHAFSDENVLLLEVFEREALRKIGTTMWCISRDSSHWRNYVNRTEFSKQYVLWNNLVEINNPEYMIAFTIHDKNFLNNNFENTNIITNAHDRRNVAFKIGDYLTKHGLNYLIPHISIKSSFDQVLEFLEYFERFPSKSITIKQSYRLNNIDFNKADIIASLKDEKFLESLNQKSDLTLLNFLYSEPELIIFDITFPKLGTSKKYWQIFFRAFPNLIRKNNEADVRYMIKIMTAFLNMTHERSVILNFNQMLPHLIDSLFIETLEHFPTFLHLNKENISYPFLDKLHYKTCRFTGEVKKIEKARIDLKVILQDMIIAKNRKVKDYKYSPSLSFLPFKKPKSSSYNPMSIWTDDISGYDKF